MENLANFENKELDYPSHLKLNSLLSCQQPRSWPIENDELFFIIIHQTYELWFKLLIHELDKLRIRFSNNSIYEAIKGWRRCALIMKTKISQFDILETMTPIDFNKFRDFLKNASGFQSYQFREIEFLLGHKRKEMLAAYKSNEVGYSTLVSRLNTPSIMDHLYDFLECNGVIIHEDLRNKDITLPTIENEIIQKGIVALYKQHPSFEFLFEAMLDFDESFSKWRYYHLKTVERLIGNKIGTGGSSNLDRTDSTEPAKLYVSITRHGMFFLDLWAVRDRL